MKILLIFFAQLFLFVNSWAGTLGEVAYKAQCLQCHGQEIDGNGPVGSVLQPPTPNLKILYSQLNSPSIHEKISSYFSNPASGKSNMHNFNTLSDTDKKEITKYLIDKIKK
jgi:mono/diheme cytochrome c family protein